MNDNRRRAQFATASLRQYRACFGKIKLPSKRNAVAIARAAEKAHDDGRWSSYRCPLCKGWHIGHADRARRSPA